MPKNLVICCDGTNNQFGPENTNVVRVIQALVRDPSRQRLYYDPGVGTLPEPGAWTAIGKKVSTFVGLAFGAGIFWKVQQAYEFLMQEWEPGDKVFVFGFSRGAYTARLLAAVLHSLGLLPRGNENLIPYVLRLFKGIPHGKSGTAVQEYFSLCDEFRRTFGRVVPEEPDDRRFHVHCLGLWDTVSSVGWLWDPPSYPYTATNPSVDVVWHAISIDERRWLFRQNRVYQARTDQQLHEEWFPGVHSDVGGGYPEADGGLWRAPFAWILDGTQASGLLVDPGRLAAVLTRTPPPVAPCEEPKHESLTAAWWPAEFLPKLQYRSALGRSVPAIGRGRHRRIAEGASIHACALHRLRGDRTYRPPNLSRAFVDAVCALSTVPASLPYAPDAVPGATAAPSGGRGVSLSV
jgi:uncharacterized protein (DUF2235 family)